MKKKILITVGILVVIPILLAAGAVLFIDPIVRAAVEKGAASALKVPVHLDRASIRWSGRATLGKFDVGNPHGFTEQRALAFDQVDVAVGPGDLLKHVVHIGEVTILKPEVVLEFMGTKNNLSALMDNLSAGRTAPGAETSSGKKFLIHKLRIQEGKVSFKSDLLSGGARSVTLPPLQLENIGTAEGGATLREILQTVLQSLTSAALKAGEGILPAGLLDNLRNSVRELPARTVEEIQKQTDELQKRAEKELDPSELQKKLKGRLQRKTAD
ncbi:MAG TPA: hypothetical protein VNM14_13840 [Planctomycetota bacterium]|nr:hypothetical protein [Planctomycetota bacterium]